MATFSQIPGVMNLILKAGDSVGTTVDFDVSLSGHTVSADIYSLVSYTKIGDISTSISNATAGTVTLTFPHSQLSAIPVGSYGWKLSWTSPGDEKRTVLAGVAEIVR